jgi:predicted glycoside hydrolase/deacetylase ChbG (UPF0249 family)
MKNLVTVADDFGFTKGVADGCLDAYNNGILREMSIMMDSPGTDYTVERIKKENIKGVGIHITLSDLNNTGKYLRTADYQEMLTNGDFKALKERINDEFKKFEDSIGKIPTHINGHQNCCLHPNVIDAVIEYALDNDVFVRRSQQFKGDNPGAGGDTGDIMKKSGVKTSDYIFEQIIGTYDQAYQGFLDDLAEIEDNTTTEIFFHPAVIDDVLKSYTSLIDERERDVKLLKDESFKNKLTELGFNITRYSKL